MYSSSSMLCTVEGRRSSMPSSSGFNTIWQHSLDLCRARAERVLAPAVAGLDATSPGSRVFQLSSQVQHVLLLQLNGRQHIELGLVLDDHVARRARTLATTGAFDVHAMIQRHLQHSRALLPSCFDTLALGSDEHDLDSALAS